MNWEIVRDYETHVIGHNNKQALIKLMSVKPPARQVLPDSPFTEIEIPRIEINNINTSESQELSEYEMLTNVQGGGKVSYTGTAEISNQIIDTGLEIPTLIHSTPEEALNLGSFPPEIRPYLENIFLKKYRNVVSLHSLDAGDVSKTLGYTTLRLIPGEKLPRHKRIYQLSPQDAKYLDDLLEQFIRFNYVRRAPIESTDVGQTFIWDEHIPHTLEEAIRIG